MVLLIPFLYKYIKNIHTGWFVLILPFALFLYFLSLLPITSSGQTIMKAVNWVPSLKINFGLYVDDISLLFSLLITGIGTLVIIYSIYYLPKLRSEEHTSELQSRFDIV